MGSEPRPLPSTDVTRCQRYYEPLRHPSRPDLSLAGVRFTVTRRLRWGFPCCIRSPCPGMLLSSTPVGSLSRIRSWDGLFQPFPFSSASAAFPKPPKGSAPTSIVSRPHRKFTCVAACLFAEPPSGSLHRRFRRFRCLHRRSDCFRLERPSCRAGLAPAEDPCLFTAHGGPQKTPKNTRSRARNATVPRRGPRERLQPEHPRYVMCTPARPSRTSLSLPCNPR